MTGLEDLGVFNSRMAHSGYADLLIFLSAASTTLSVTMPFGHESVARAYALKSSLEAKTLYDEWATSYDTDLESENYASPTLTVDAIVSRLDQIPRHAQGSIKALDAGCGTGLVGALLAKKLSQWDVKLDIEGLDLSFGMLAAAKEKGCYSKLEEADLSQPLKRSDASFGLITCVGTLTQGHVGPGVIEEFSRVAGKGAFIALTIMDSIFETGGYDAMLTKLKEARDLEEIQNEPFGFTEGSSGDGRLLVLRRL